MIRKWSAALVVALSCLGLVTAAAAAAEDKKPSGTVNIASKSVAIGVGVSWVMERSTSKARPMRSRSTDSPSWTSASPCVTTTGEEFNLNKLSDFHGNYVAGAAGIAIAGGANEVIMKNEHGVVLRMRGTEKGAKLTLGPHGVKITLKN